MKMNLKQVAQVVPGHALELYRQACDTAETTFLPNPRKRLAELEYREAAQSTATPQAHRAQEPRMPRLQ